MNEKDQTIVDAIENLPAVYGPDHKKQKAINLAKYHFREKKEAVFFAESGLSIDQRKELLQEVVDRIKKKIVRLDEYSLWHGGEIKQDGMRWLEVKAGKGKTEKSRRCKIEIWKAHGNCKDEWEKGISSFYAPATMVLECGGKAYLPEFFVTQKLERRYPKFYRKIPTGEVCWPVDSEYMQRFLPLLPTEKEIEQDIAVKKRQDQERTQREIEEKARRDARHKEYEEKNRQAAEMAAIDAKKREKAKLARRVKQGQEHNVNVLVKWTELRGKQLSRGEYELENVTLYYVGEKMVDIVEVGGKETRKHRDNVKIIHAGKKERLSSLPVGCLTCQETTAELVS